MQQKEESFTFFRNAGNCVGTVAREMLNETKIKQRKEGLPTSAVEWLEAAVAGSAKTALLAGFVCWPVSSHRLSCVNGQPAQKEKLLNLPFLCCMSTLDSGVWPPPLPLETAHPPNTKVHNTKWCDLCRKVISGLHRK